MHSVRLHCRMPRRRRRLGWCGASIAAAQNAPMLSAGLPAVPRIDMPLRRSARKTKGPAIEESARAANGIAHRLASTARVACDASASLACARPGTPCALDEVVDFEASAGAQVRRAVAEIADRTRLAL